MTRTVKRGGKAIELLPREFRLLEYLMRNAGHVVTRTMLLEHVWDYHFDPQTNVIDVHVSRLRQKIDKSFDQPAAAHGARRRLLPARPGVTRDTAGHQMVVEQLSRSGLWAIVTWDRRRRFSGSARRLVRTHAFRLAALYFLVFAASVLGVLLFVYWTSADFVERQTEATLDAEITGLAEQYAQRGLSGLVQIVAARSAGDRGDAHALSGDQSRRQAARRQHRGWPTGVPTHSGLAVLRARANGQRPPSRLIPARGRLFVDPRRLPPAGRARHQRRGGVSRPGQDRRCCGPGWSRSASGCSAAR